MTRRLACAYLLSCLAPVAACGALGRSQAPRPRLGRNRGRSRPPQAAPDTRREP
ncbi:hypothetical protein [Kitasatospora sp. McL0602]|uniref:hypothetical protein n=1 Tax=Kitasatospora sp. McL0602 TaxID=3439530 RepID=UPI003F88A788